MFRKLPKIGTKTLDIFVPMSYTKSVPSWYKKIKEKAEKTMEKTVTMNGQQVTISTNGKKYGKRQYFTVRQGNQSSQYTWNEDIGFEKNNASPVADAIRREFGLK